MLLKLLSHTLGRLRLLAFAEGVSFLLLLLVAMPLKYIFNLPQPNYVIGLAHGILFVLYVLHTLMATLEYRWSALFALRLLVASFIPLGTFYADRKWLSQIDLSDK